MLTPILLATSSNRNPIHLFSLGGLELPKLVLIGGIHGDEPEGSTLVHDFIQTAEPLSARFKCCVLAIPAYNPDGLSENQRTNGRGVDLNRNFPSKDWSPVAKAPRYYPGTSPASEPETQGLVRVLTREKPFLVVHCHTYLPQVNYTGEASRPWAEWIARDFGHPVTEDIGYPTPGSLGQYCLHDLHVPCVCIELPEQVERAPAQKMVIPRLLEIALHGP